MGMIIIYLMWVFHAGVEDEQSPGAGLDGGIRGPVVVEERKLAASKVITISGQVD